MRKLPELHRICRFCGKEFIVTKRKYDRVFCNSTCLHKSKIKTLQYKKLICSHCGKSYWKREDRLKSMKVKGYKNTYCSPDCHHKSMSGDKCVTWAGGYEKLDRRIRRSSRYKTWRRKVLDYFSYTCTKCGTTKEDVHVHHKNIKMKDLMLLAKSRFPEKPDYEACYDTPEFWDISNGEAVCRGCHMQLHGCI